MLFLDRADAGRRLAGHLLAHRFEAPVVLAVPRGGVPVAAEIAALLRAPLDLVLARKLVLPQQPELAMGAVVEGPRPIVVRNEEVIRNGGVTQPEFETACRLGRAELERYRLRYRSRRQPVPLSDRAVIVVDDGVGTGATLAAALQAVRRRGPRMLVLAVPVAPLASLEQLRPLADAVACLETLASPLPLARCYRDIAPPDDRNVSALLARCSPARHTPAA